MLLRYRRKLRMSMVIDKLYFPTVLQNVIMRYIQVQAGVSPTISVLAASWLCRLIHTHLGHRNSVRCHKIHFLCSWLDHPCSEHKICKQLWVSFTFRTILYKRCSDKMFKMTYWKSCAPYLKVRKLKIHDKPWENEFGGAVWHCGAYFLAIKCDQNDKLILRIFNEVIWCRGQLYFPTPYTYALLLTKIPLGFTLNIQFSSSINRVTPCYLARFNVYCFCLHIIRLNHVFDLYQSIKLIEDEWTQYR